MAPARPNPNKVVVACLDGRRLKGHVYNFSMAKDSFRLFPQEDSHENEGTDICLKDLKAIFFVKDFVGHPEHYDVQNVPLHAHGRALEVNFPDGERIIGTTEAFNPARIGFFLFPVDQTGNNIRVFVINKSAREIKRL